MKLRLKPCATDDVNSTSRDAGNIQSGDVSFTASAHDEPRVFFANGMTICEFFGSLFIRLSRGSLGKHGLVNVRAMISVSSLLLIALLVGQPVSAQDSPQTSVATGRVFTDEIGRRVQVPANVSRIVSLAPNLTEIVFALGKGDELAGDTDFCDYPAEAVQKPHVGGPDNPNLEQIVALKPDIILATMINRRETVSALDRLGLPVYFTDPHTVDGMIESVEHLGAVLGAQASASVLAEDLRARLGDLDRRLAGIAPRRALFVVWTDPLISIGRDTFIADAMRRAGGQSVVDTAAEWPRVSFEEVVRLQPEFLVFASAHAADTRHDIDALRTRPGWRDLDAIRRGNVVIVSDAINRPAPRMVDAVEQMARAFHSETFALRVPQIDHRLARPVRAAEETCACAR